MTLAELLQHYSSESEPINFGSMLSSRGISLRAIKSDYYAYQLTLPVSLEAFNAQLPQADRFTAGENMYLPPAPIIAHMRREDCSAANILAEEKRKKLVLSCEQYGHAFGFLFFYAARFIKDEKSIRNL